MKAKFIPPVVGIGLLLLVSVFGLRRGSAVNAGAQDLQRTVGIGVTGVSGFLIQSVESGSPAEHNGVRPGDVIVSMDGRPVKSEQDMWDVFHNSLATPDKQIEVVFLRYDANVNQIVEHRFKATPIIKSQEVNVSSHRTISGGVLDGKAITKPNPIYPDEAKSARASGDVVVRIVVNEDGTVETAQAVSGHPLLQKAAADAAYKARFPP